MTPIEENVTRALGQVPLKIFVGYAFTGVPPVA